MRRNLLTLILLACVVILGKAQTETAGMNYQAVIRDALGKVLANAPVTIKVALVSEKNNSEAYYTEIHQTTTDLLGQISLVIGSGKEQKGTLREVPWAKEQIWLDVELLSQTIGTFKINSRTQLLSVPYALHAATTMQLSEEQATEKNQSIYWHTGGNSNTLPSTHFVGTRDNKSLVLKTNNQTLMTFKTNGQTHVSGRVTGADDATTSYPMTITGSTQGIYIKVLGSRNNTNNFVTFADASAIWGRIEGQTFDELEDTWQYKAQVTAFALEGTAIAALIISEGIESAGQGGSIFGIGAAVAGFATVAELIINAAALLAESITWGVNIRKDIGVTYASGAGDYAEWLQRKPGERDIHYGEIVGLSGGLVSLNTQDADHVMVVSKRPAVLGNAPQPSERTNYEKIAFMGQVPVKVAGPVALGDYIVASGNQDGFGVAIHPQDMKSGDYTRAVGVAWEAASDHPMHYVNVAVGINTNDLSNKLDQLNQEIDNVVAYLEGKAPLLDDSQLKESISVNKSANPHTTFKKLMTDEEFDQMLDQHQEVYLQVFAKAKIEMEKRGYDVAAIPQLAEFLDNPIQSLRSMRRNPAYLTQWALVDQNYLKNKSRK